MMLHDLIKQSDHLEEEWMKNLFGLVLTHQNLYLK